MECHDHIKLLVKEQSINHCVFNIHLSSIGLNSIGTSLSGYSSVNGIPSYILQNLGIEGPVTNKVFVANVSKNRLIDE